MKRRKFLLASGASVLSGSTIGSTSEPTFSLEFEISKIDSYNPSDTKTILVSFSSFKLTPVYLDESEAIDLTIEINIEGDNMVTREASDINFRNGEIIDTKSVEQQSGTSIDDLLVDGLDKSGSRLEGRVLISVNHKDISRRTYQETFEIIDQENIIDSFEDQDYSEYNTLKDTTANFTFSSNKSIDGTYSAVFDMNDSRDMGAVSTSGLDTYPSRGDKTSCWIQTDTAGNLNRQNWVIASNGNTDGRSFEGYHIGVNYVDNNFYIRKDSMTSNSILLDRDTAVSLSSNTWYEIEALYKMDNTIEAELFDINGNSISDKLSATESSYKNNTGFGFVMNCFTDDSGAQALFDYPRIL